MITVYKPFYNLPVRRQLAQKNVHQHLKKIQELLIAYALAHTNIRFSSIQSTSTVGCNTSKNNAWIKPVTSNIEGSLTVIYGASLSNMLDRWIETESTLTVDLVIPKSNSGKNVYTSAFFFFFFLVKLTFVL
jgi:DNA mismatch repair ATPase MutL